MARFIRADKNKNSNVYQVRVITDKVCFVLRLTGCSGDCNVPMKPQLGACWYVTEEAKYRCCMNVVRVVKNLLWWECHSCYLQLYQNASNYISSVERKQLYLLC